MLAAALLAALSLGCQSIAPTRLQTQPPRDDTRFTVIGEQIDGALLEEVQVAANGAQRDVAVWGRLTEPVLIVVHPSHRALEQAVGLRDLAWLRAWARYDRIDLQSPTTFGHRDFRAPLRELLAHELTHVFMYQRIGSRENWNHIAIPFWFREGMGSWTSHQGYRRGNLASVGGRLLRHPVPFDPLLDTEALNRVDQPLAYAASHWAFDRLVVDIGEDGVLELLDDVRAAATSAPASDVSSPAVDGAAGDAPPLAAGTPFALAFERRVGMTEAEFSMHFRQTLQEASDTTPAR